MATENGMKKLKGLEFVISGKSSTIDDFDIDVTDLHVYSDVKLAVVGVLTVDGRRNLCHENIEFLSSKSDLLTTSTLFVQGFLSLSLYLRLITLRGFFF